MFLVLFLFLSFPGPLAAGSATSRWDLTIGGFVKFELDYRDYGRQGFDGSESLRDKYGTISFNSTATRLNFLTRGPEAWGGRTFAFVEGDFIGTYAGSGRGSFALRHGFFSLEWDDTKLTVGQTFQKWGYLPTYAYAIVSGQDLSPFIKGHRQPMIRLEHKFRPHWNLSFAVMSPTNTLGSNRSTIVPGADGFSLSGMPFYEASLGWSTERFGRIGPWMALFNLEGFYGREKQIVTLYTGSVANPLSVSYGDKDVDCWGVALKGFLPLIPEKKGDKTGALSLSGVLFTAQNPSWLQSRTYAVSSYSRPGGVSPAPAQPESDPLPDFVAPRMYGLWGQVSYFFTDKLFINGWYGYLRNDTGIEFDSAVSSSGRFVHANTVKNSTQYIVSLCYDANQAVRFALEYAYFVTRYANYGAVTFPDGTINPSGLSKDATQQAFRLGVWYFF